MRIFIVDDEPLIRMDICEMVKDAGFQVIGEASDGFDAIEGCKKFNPDIMLLDIKMPILDGLKTAEILKKDGYKGCIIMLTAYNSSEFIDKADKIGVMGYFIKPIDERNFIPNLKIFYSRHQEMLKFQKEIVKVNNKLEERKMVERAKGLLMENKKYSENQAYNYMRKLSM
ncbi:MAG: ANTAR domain-containing response regulator, partial [Fusobacteriaceae bacterium]